MRQPARVMLACRVQMEEKCVHSVWQASTRLRQEMLHAAPAQQVNILRRLAPHPMCVKHARQAPTHLRRATNNPTALATLVRPVLMVVGQDAASASRGPGRL